MSKCPRCGSIVTSPKKKWTMTGRPDASGKRIVLEIGLFDCPNCRKPFREVLNKRKVGGASVTNAPSQKQSCKACRHDNPVDYKFCGQCGAPLTDEKTRIY